MSLPTSLLPSAIASLPVEIFWTPERLVRPDWAGHIPFQFLLFKLMQPRLYVELGVFHGDSYCAACQCVKSLSLPTRMVGIDCWKGDIHTGSYGNVILRDLEQHHNPRYAHFSSLEQGFFEEKRPLFEDGSIDVLHIDGEHTYEAVRRDFETWLPKVARNGIVLFHDTDVFDRPDFGVWKLWDELSKRHPSFRFTHCHGLGVLSVGPVEGLPDGIKWLFTLHDAEARAVKQLFAAIGEQHVQQAWRGLEAGGQSRALQRRVLEATLGP